MMEGGGGALHWDGETGPGGAAHWGQGTWKGGHSQKTIPSALRIPPWGLVKLGPEVAGKAPEKKALSHTPHLRKGVRRRGTERRGGGGERGASQQRLKWPPDLWDKSWREICV